MIETDETRQEDGKVLWHVVVGLVYDGLDGDTCEDGVEKVKKALNPVVGNRSIIKGMSFLRLPEKYGHSTVPSRRGNQVE